MKKWKKVVTAAAAVLAVVASTAALAGCSGGAAAVADVYSANPSSEGTAMYVTTPMQMIVSNVEEITVYEDNTYSFSVSTTVITNLKAVTEGNDQVINRGVTELVYHGSYTSEEDSGMTILTLAEPTRITVANTDSLFTAGLPVGYMDTESWETSEELNTWWTALGNTGDCTAEAFLEKMAFDETTVVVSETGMFDYIEYSLHNILLGW